MRESIALVRRFNQEVVERYNLCPWSAPARNAQRSWVEPCLMPVASAEQLKDALHAPIMRADLVGEGFGGVLQVAFPLVEQSSRDWERVVAAAGRLMDGELALAAFHPEYTFDTLREGSAVRSLRRTPSPSVQVIARDALPAQDSQRYLPAEEIEQLLSARPTGGASSDGSATERVRAQNMRLLRGGSANAIRSLQDALIAAQRELVREYRG